MTTLNFLLNLLFTFSGIMLLITGIVYEGIIGALDMLFGGIVLAVIGAGYAVKRRWI